MDTLLDTSSTIGSRRSVCLLDPSLLLADSFTPKGVPLRLEIGPNDIAKQQTLTVRRDTGVKNAMSINDIGSTISTLLQEIQKDMFIRARDVFDSRLKEITNWPDLVPHLDNKGIAVIPWCEVEACEDDIKERSARS
jgi:prolyl-tRNA synthetase